MRETGTALLITGPAGSGKSTLAQYAAKKSGWQVVSEDDFWVNNGWGSGLRSSEHEKIIQQKVIDYLVSEIQKGQNVALEFILYYPTKPNPLSNYQDRLREQGVNYRIIALKPSVDEIMKRLKKRGRPNDLKNLEARRKDAERQVACLEAEYVRPDWVFDPTNKAVEDLYTEATTNLLI